MPEYSTDESTFAHDCNNKRLRSLTYTSEDVMNPSSGHLAQLWKADISSAISWGGNFDAVYDDMADYVGNATGLPCNFNQSNWTSNTNAMISALGKPVVYNGLAALGTGGTVSPIIGLNATAIGGMCEGCYTAVGRFQPHGTTWIGMENTEIQMAQAHKFFMIRGLNAEDAASMLGLRMYNYASYLLTYDLNTSVYTPIFSTPSGLHIFPEMQFVALSPVVAQPSNITALHQSSGVYGREYNACYLAGKSVGRCAVAVNSDGSAAHAFPWTGKYAHTLVVSGRGVIDGGTVRVDGPVPPKQMPLESGVIALP